MTDGCLAPLHGEGRSATADPGGVWWEGKGLPHPGSLEGSPSLPTRGRETRIKGYASLWGVADLNRDVTARGCFGESLAARGASGVKMLHQHADAPVGVWDALVEDARGLRVAGRVMDWSPQARFCQALVRAGALDGLSIGFRAVAARKDGALRVLSAVDLWEVSLVTFPMLPGARLRLS